jgi:hypothetical protein
MKATNIGIVKAIIAKKMSEDFLTEGYNGSKAEAGEFLNVVKNSPLLQLEYKVFDRLENKHISSDIAATRYIDNNLSLFEQYSQEDVLNERAKLTKFIDENIAFIDKNKYDLYIAISDLISETLNKNPDVDLIHESFVKVLNHIKKEKIVKEEKTRDIVIPKEIDSDKLIEVALNKFSKKYETLDEEDISLIKKLVLSEEEDKKNIFTSLKEESISILESTEKNGIEDKIHETIDKIKKMEYDDSSIKNIVSLHQLKKDLV